MIEVKYPEMREELEERLRALAEVAASGTIDRLEDFGISGCGRSVESHISFVASDPRPGGTSI